MNDANPQRRGTRTLGIVFIWIALLCMLAIGFAKYLEIQTNPNPDPPGRVTDSGVAEVVLAQNRLGHYVAGGRVNDRPVEFLLDTGATTVSVPLEVAEKIGLQPGPPQKVLTANGVATVYATTLDSVEIGNISVGNVRANINPNMPGKKILLGMSFLRHLEMLQAGDHLRLRLPGVNAGRDP